GLHPCHRRIPGRPHRRAAGCAATDHQLLQFHPPSPRPACGWRAGLGLAGHAGQHRRCGPAGVAQAACPRAGRPTHRPHRPAELPDENHGKTFMNTALQTLESRLQTSLGQAVVGMQPVIRALTIAVVARGHVLLQGPPGLGKTLLSKSLATALGGTFRRVQGTADLMPSDVVGVHVYDSSRNEFVFRAGPLFADVLLADEINRTGPKTQSALLEAMEERQVSVDGKQFALPADFLVIATQNPRDVEGHYPLPESQLDRVMLRIDLPYPSREHEQQVLQQYGRMTMQPATQSQSAVGRETLEAARAEVENVHVAPELAGYV